MPFTLAHPAAVLWLARGPLSLLALCAGAVAPDLPYYLRATPLQVTADSWYEPFVNATSSHSLVQLVPVALPLALVVYLCGCFLLPPARSIAGIDSRATATPPGLPAAFVRGAWILVSLCIGVLTHLAWDALTELGGSGSALLQHGSTAVGLLIIAVVLLQRRKAVRWQDPVVRRRLIATSAVCVLGALAGALAAIWSWLDEPSGLSTSEIVEGVLTDGVKGAGGGLVVAAVAVACAWWIARMRPKDRATEPVGQSSGPA